MSPPGGTVAPAPDLDAGESAPDPPPDEEGRPGEKAAHSKSSGYGDKPTLRPAPDDPEQDSPLAQMKRRRMAALRLPPLADGRRDPQFDLDSRDGAA